MKTILTDPRYRPMKLQSALDAVERRFITDELDDVHINMLLQTFELGWVGHAYAIEDGDWAAALRAIEGTQEYSYHDPASEAHTPHPE